MITAVFGLITSIAGVACLFMALVIKSQDKKISALEKELRARKSILERN